MKSLVDAFERIVDILLARVAAIIPLFLAIATTAGFFSSIGLLAKIQVPSASHDVLLALIGSLGTAWIGIINFYFGSSAGSAKKTEILAKNGDRQP